MQLIDIHHIAIKTLDLDATNTFYVDLLGMSYAQRPPFSFPGSWLSMGATMIHVFAGEGAVDKSGRFTAGGAAVDHIAIFARDFDGFRKKVAAHGLPYREVALPAAGLWQLFVHDPNRILIELNFRIADEPAGAAGPDPANPYIPGEF